jgi:hypothetical protein
MSSVHLDIEKVRHISMATNSGVVRLFRNFRPDYVNGFCYSNEKTDDLASAPSLVSLNTKNPPGIILAANAGPRVPSGGVTLKRRCMYLPTFSHTPYNIPIATN